jgi:hypothetical protein
MLGEQRQHVIQKTNACSARAGTRTVQIDGQLDFCLGRVAINGCGSLQAHNRLSKI